MIVTVALPRTSTAFDDGFDSDTVNVSVDSWTVSPRIWTLKNTVVTPAAKVSVVVVVL